MKYIDLNPGDLVVYYTNADVGAHCLDLVLSLVLEPQLLHAGESHYYNITMLRSLIDNDGTTSSTEIVILCVHCDYVISSHINIIKFSSTPHCDLAVCDIYL